MTVMRPGPIFDLGNKRRLHKHDVLLTGTAGLFGLERVERLTQIGGIALFEAGSDEAKGFWSG